MARERITDDYEDFEPDVTIWPFVLLAFLLQLLPLTLTVLLKGGLSFGLFLRAVVGMLPLLFAASIMRNGERPWKLPVASVAYGTVELILWMASSRSGAASYSLGIPFALAVSPAVLGLVAYVFFLKRIHGKWIGTVLVSYLLLLVFFLSLWRYSSNMGVWMVYPIGLVVLTTSVLPVTRRSDSTPWFVVIPLVYLVLTSALFSQEFSRLFLEAHNGRMVAEAILAVLAFDQPFWYTLSFLFVFSGLASKSSYRRFYEDDSTEQSSGEGSYSDDYASSYEEEDQSYVPTPEPYSIRDDSRYTFPSGESRYGRQSEEEMPRREEPSRTEESQPRETESRGRDQAEETRRREREDYRKTQSSSNDKWYEFISGGINVGDDDKPSKEPSRPTRPSYEDRYERRDYEDRRDYRRDSRYSESERDAYLRNLYDDRRDDRDRYYDDRRDRRDYDDRRDYRRDDRYYDRRDDRGYDERDRRDYPRSPRRYEDDYRDDRGRYDRDDRN